MSELSSEMKSMENGMSARTDRQHYLERAQYSPWPKTQNSGAFGALTDQPRKYRGGFGGGEGFSDFGSVSGLGGRIPRNSSHLNDSSGFGSVRGGYSSYRESRSSRVAVSDALYMNNERCVTPLPSENIMGSPRRGSFRSSPRSDGMGSSSKRPRSGRRTGRRGRGGPGHCFHCQEHGHISRMCPKKVGETDEHGDGKDIEVEPFETKDLLQEDASRYSSNMKALHGGGLYQSKLDNQKARESYYGGYGYSINSLTPRSVGSVRSGFTAPMMSPEIDKFSEQLDNALKLSNVEPVAPSPYVMTITGKGPAEKLMKEVPPVAPINTLQSREGAKQISTETLSIETRRTVMRDGEFHFEETTIINFPRVLPPNVRVIAAQFVPVASQNS